MSTQLSPTEQPVSAIPRESRWAETGRHWPDNFTLLDLLTVLAAHKHLIFILTAGCAVVSVIVSFLLPPRYTATITLLPPHQNTSLASVLTQVSSMGEMALLAGGGLNLKNQNDTYVGMLRSRTVEDAVVRAFGLMNEYHDRYLSNARKDFEHNSTVDGNKTDGLIHISVEDRSPARAVQLANGYVDQFRTLSAHLAVTEAERRQLYFAQQLEQAKVNLANAEEAFEATEQKTGMIQLTSQSSALIETAISLREQITAKQVQLQGMQTYASSQNAQYIQIQKELGALREELAKLGGSEDPSDSGLLIPKGKIPEVGLEYMRKQRDVQYYEAIFEILARQEEIARLDEAKEGSIVQVVDPAMVPDKRSSPQRGLIVIAATVFGFCMSVLLALWMAAMQHLNQGPETASKMARLRRSLSFR